MSSSLRRGVLAAAIAISSLGLTACGAGNSAATLEVKPDNAETAVGDVKIQNAMVITQPDEATGPAVVSARIFNNGRTDQTVDSVTLTGTSTSAQLTPAQATGKVVVPAGGSVMFGGKGNASAVLPEGHEAVRAGDAQALTFTFSKTGEVKMTGFVVPANSYFTEWGPSELPKPTASAKPGASGKPKDSASPDASASTGSGH
ncbi:DUF461 domain-containing protein [Streptomyces sp. NPDC058045]|uniref:DUF461 domain-containing protein n=1 Tax=Streptomyces sp. NPDC058045 TaxID=3346311 RepID=UPI0036E6332D